MIFEEDHLEHFGTPRKSGRYPWGSGGDTQSQRNKSFLDYVQVMKEKGLSDSEIYKGMGMTSTEFRNRKTIAKNEQKQLKIDQANRLGDAGMSNVAIGKEMGLNESSVRSLRDPGQKEKVSILQSTADMLRRAVDKKTYVDIGTGVENHLGISKEKLGAAVALLRDEGYVVHTVQINQLGTSAGKLTGIKVLAPPGTEYKDIAANKSKIQQIRDFTEDQGRTWYSNLPPLSISSKRIDVRFAEDGGSQADGVLFVRPGIDDISLGKNNYAQVRVAVDGTHYLKGMAMYKDDLPKGVDIVFNTNKSKSDTTKMDAMKDMKTDDVTNPFGSVFRQIQKDGPDGKKVVTSAMNLVNEQGDWEKWKKTISSQVLSKQSPRLAKTQLDMMYEKNKNKLDEILSLTNPAVRRKLLETYAENADSSAVHLKAAHLPRQASHVILPINTMKPTEIYAPNYRNGERVALIRYPHGGKFEIPELIVNNRHPEAKKLIGPDSQDAVGINHKVAEHLSGADFDGDTVMVIPNPIGAPHLKTAPALEALKGFDPQRSYPGYEGMKPMTAHVKSFQMGDVSNLITDMTIKGAPSSELARAVKHSMVVIDAEKHGLNWRQSAKEQGITALKTKYQGRANAGASTLISQASSRIDVRKRTPRAARDGGPVDKATGKKVFTPTGEHWINEKTGKVVYRTEPSKKLAETDDAHTLVSKPTGTKIEEVYADHSNRMKALANRARLEAVHTENTLINPSAKTVYKNEIETLNAKLNVAFKNRPRERQAQVIANTSVEAKKQANPDLDPVSEKKLKYLELEKARTRTGARKQQIEPTDREWEAIQAGAIPNSKLKDILNNSNLDRIKELATPKIPIMMTSAKTSRAKAMIASGYTQSEVADALGVSLTTLKVGLGDG